MSKNTNYFSILKFVFSIFFLICLLSNVSAYSQSLLEFSKKNSDNNIENIVYEGNVGLELVSENIFVLPGETINVGLRIIHDPEWHTYWYNPGDTGLRTTINWSFSQSDSLWKIGAIQWPSPKRIIVGPLANFGFEDEILLIQQLTAPDALKAGRYLRLIADVKWLVCKDICIPGSKRLEMKLPIANDNGGEKLSKNSILFANARENLPVEKNYTNRIKAALDVDNKNLVLFQNYTNSPNKINEFKLSDGFFFPYKEGLIQPSKEQVFYNIQDENNLDTYESKNWLLEIQLAKNSSELIKEINIEKKIRGVFVDDNGRGEIWQLNLVDSENLPKKGSLINFKNQKSISIDSSFFLMQTFSAIFFAFLGGLILNLMPCVFPVISLKILSITEGIEDRNLLINHGFGFVVGVILSVMSFAVFFIVLREFGHSVGWGLQLQNAWVVLSLATLFAVIAMNLIGVFEFGTKLSSLGIYDNKKGFSGAFFSGVLTVIVASPCTAPFMGGAIGFAATANLYQVIVIFFSLSIGISLPYLLLISQPNLLRKLPKPGEWMIKLRQFLAFPMLATSGWLFWVLIEIKGSGSLFPAWLAILFICMSLWIWGKFFQSSSAKYKTKIFLTPILLLIISLSILFFYISAHSTKSKFNNNQISIEKKDKLINSNKANDIEWLSWRENLAEDYVNSGFVVFLDFTASWCITCQINKIRVLDSKLIVKELSKSDVVAIRADWTNSDSRITKALLDYNRIGIPLNVIMGPGLKEPLILSEWLTKTEVLNAIREAKN